MTNSGQCKKGLAVSTELYLRISRHSVEDCDALNVTEQDGNERRWVSLKAGLSERCSQSWQN